MLRSLKVKLDVELLEELGDGVRVLILFELYNLDDLPYRVPHARAHRRTSGCTCRLRPAREHGGDGDVAQDPGRGGLDGVEVGGGEECLEEESAASGVVEVDEEGPVHEPGTRVERREGLRVRRCCRRGRGRCSGRRERGCACTRVERLAQRVELLERHVPLAREDVRGKLAPVRGRVQIGVGGQHAEVVEVVGSARVVPVRVLELSKVVQCGDLFEGELKRKLFRINDGIEPMGRKTTSMLTP